MNMFTHLRHLTRAALAGGLLLVSGSALAAQDAATDSRWLPWTGCWQATGTDTGLLCVQQADGGVEFLSVAEEGVVSDETIVADGQPRPIEDETCEGTTTAEFSRDGERVYLREEIDCDGTREVSTGLIAMISPNEWVDIRGSETGEGVWTRIFRRVTDEYATSRGFPDANDDDDLSARMLRWRASEPSDFDDLMEVYERSGSAVTRAWVAEQMDPFAVSADALVELDEAGLPDEVIDVVVAHAFPERFALARGEGYERRPSDVTRTRPYGGSAWVGIDPWAGYWSPWSYRYRGFWGNRFGYPYGGGWGWGYGGGIVIVDRTDQPSRPGDSRQVRPRPGGGYTWSGGSSGGGTQPARVSGGGGPTRTTVSSGGVSGGRSTGRTAKPRTGGGGEL